MDAVNPTANVFVSVLFGRHALNKTRAEATGATTNPLDEKQGIGISVRPGSAGRLGLEGLRCLHEISFVIQRVQIPPGQG